MVAENCKYDDLTEVAKLFNMYKGLSQGISEDLNNDENTDWNLQLSFFLFEKPYFFLPILLFYGKIKCPILAYLLIVFSGILLVFNPSYSQSSGQKFSQWDEFDRGVVFYQDKNEVVIGVLFWDVFNHISTARRVVAENLKYDDLILK